ncbi:MAG: aminotransferase class V-fold PLP-dependent enzyme, partial [Bullifex sp.]|nr:aminotransferase class V-fold PLP-dependent enzyme [Bullifex sp.]
MNRIYLDNSATSFPKPKDVLSAMEDYFLNNGSNIQRGETEYNFSAEDKIISLRERLSILVNSAHPENTVFTQNVTSALNTVIQGYLSEGDEVLISPLEHNAVMRVLIEKKIKYRDIPADVNGVIIPDEIAKLITQKTKAVIIQAANNVTGAVQPVHETGQILSEYGLPLIIDSAQALPHIDLDMEADSISVLCFTGHKGLLGPQGTGGFIARPEMIKKIKPLIFGGTGSFSDLLTQPENLPDRFESGTQNIIGLIGLEAALEYLERNKDGIRKKERCIKEYFLNTLLDIQHIKIHSASAEIPIVSLSSKDFDVAELSNYLAANNVQTRVGLHCNVMTHRYIGTYPEGTIRFSFSHYNTKE